MQTLKRILCLSAVACSVCFCLTGCGNDKNGSTSGNNDNNVLEDTADHVGDAADDLMEGAGEVVDDTTDSIGNAVDDLVGTDGFDNYDDAHRYFLETMESYHADAKFEIRDKDRDLEDYQEGSKGYHFEVYDTSKNEKGDFFGEFYVDASTGVIYQELEDDRIVEYRGNTSTNSANGKNGTSSTNQQGNAKNTQKSTSERNSVEQNTTGSDIGTTN